MRSFDSITWFYDHLSFIIFLGRIRKANTTYSSFVKPDSGLLIIGGGTGVILPKLSAGVKADFVDASNAMIEKAKMRQTNASVVFHNVRFEEFISEKNYDLIHIPFFLDLFSEKKVNDLLEKIDHLSNENTILWVSDFVPGFEQKAITKLVFWGMKLFFKASIGLNIKKLTDIRTLLEDNGWQAVQSKSYYSGMIFSNLYQRTRS